MRTGSIQSLVFLVLITLITAGCSGHPDSPRVYDVDQVVSHEVELAGESELRVRGTVARGSLHHEDGSTRFVLTGMLGSVVEKPCLRAEIDIAPDTLRDGNDGVVAGRLVRDGEGRWVLHATSVVMRAGRRPQ